MIEGLEHVALSVSDMDRSLRFYRDLIGMPLVRVIEPGQAGDLGSVVGIEGAQARIAHLQMGGFMLELFEYTAPRGRRIPVDRTQADGGFTHIGFRTDDVRADHRRLLKAGVEFVGEPVEFRPGVWIVYFLGPDGEVCEFRQRPVESS